MLQPPGQPPLAPMPRQLKSQVGLVAVKMEYLEEWGFEMLLPDELARWWAAMTLHPQPNCQLVVSLLFPTHACLSNVLKFRSMAL